MSTKRLILVTACLSFASIASAQGDLGISGSQNPDQNRSTTITRPSSPQNAISQEAVIQYERGAAPFYANLQTYANYLFHHYRGQNNLALTREASALGLTVDDIESITLTLYKLIDRSSADWNDMLLELCIPILRGEDVSNDYAHDAISTLDNSTERRNALAEDVMAEVRDTWGDEVYEKLHNHVNEYGKSVEFSKIDLVKDIEIRQNGDFLGYLTAQCHSL